MRTRSGLSTSPQGDATPQPTSQPTSSSTADGADPADKGAASSALALLPDGKQNQGKDAEAKGELVRLVHLWSNVFPTSNLGCDSAHLTPAVTSENVMDLLSTLSATRDIWEVAKAIYGKKELPTEIRDADDIWKALLVLTTPRSHLPSSHGDESGIVEMSPACLKARVLSSLLELGTPPKGTPQRVLRPLDGNSTLTHGSPTSPSPRRVRHGVALTDGSPSPPPTAVLGSRAAQSEEVDKLREALQRLKDRLKESEKNLAQERAKGLKELRLLLDSEFERIQEKNSLINGLQLLLKHADIKLDDEKKAHEKTKKAHEKTKKAFVNEEMAHLETAIELLKYMYPADVATEDAAQHDRTAGLDFASFMNGDSDPGIPPQRRANSLDSSLLSRPSSSHPARPAITAEPRATTCLREQVEAARKVIQQDEGGAFPALALLALLADGKQNQGNDEERTAEHVKLVHKWLETSAPPMTIENVTIMLSTLSEIALGFSQMAEVIYGTLPEDMQQRVAKPQVRSTAKKAPSSLDGSSTPTDDSPPPPPPSFRSSIAAQSDEEHPSSEFENESELELVDRPLSESPPKPELYWTARHDQAKDEPEELRAMTKQANSEKQIFKEVLEETKRQNLIYKEAKADNQDLRSKLAPAEGALPAVQQALRTATGEPTVPAE